MKIVISGTVGVGKSTISNILKEHLDTKGKDVFLHDELSGDNPYLDYYYANRPAWSFLIQIDFVLGRFKSVMEEEIEISKNPNRVSIFDRHFLDDFIFANVKSIKEDMSTIQWNIYSQVNKSLANTLDDNSKPDYFILLKAPLEQVLERVKIRGRESEQEVDLDYWRDLYYQYYENPLIQDYLKQNVKNLIIVDASKSPEQIKEELIKYIE